MAIDVAAPAYAWLKDHQDYFVGQKSEARVFLLAPRQAWASPSRRMRIADVFRLLAEQHIPFAAVENLDWLGKREADLVIAPGGAVSPRGLCRAGGRLIIAGSTVPQFEVSSPVKLWKYPDGAYFRIRDNAMFPSLKQTDVVFMYGDYLQVEPEGASPITFIPPSMYGPPEFVHVDWKIRGPGPGYQGYGPRQGRVAAVGFGRHLLSPELRSALRIDERPDRLDVAQRTPAKDQRASAGRDHLHAPGQSPPDAIYQPLRPCGHRLFHPHPDDEH